MKSLTFTKQYCQNILKQRKLVLVCDMDETLLSRVYLKDPVIPQRLKNIHYNKINDSFLYDGYCAKFRPHLTNFLKKISEKFELHVMSTGTDLYIRSLIDIIDPEKKFFGNRITTKSGVVGGTYKLRTLENQFNKLDNMVCVIDDRVDVWENNGRVVQVEPYMALHKVTEINANQSDEVNNSRKSMVQQTLENIDDSDDYLKHLENTLELIHDNYFQSIDEELLKNNYENLSCENIPKIEDIISKMKIERNI